MPVKTEDYYRATTHRATSPRIYADWDNTAPAPPPAPPSFSSSGLSMSMSARARSQPPQRRRHTHTHTHTALDAPTNTTNTTTSATTTTTTPTREPTTAHEAALMGMVQRKLTPVPAPFAPDPTSTVKLDVGGHGAVCVKTFLEDAGYRAQLRRGRERMGIEDEYTQWMVAVSVVCCEFVYLGIDRLMMILRGWCVVVAGVQ